jgi:dihydroorotate dehydrogenase
MEAPSKAEVRAAPRPTYRIDKPFEWNAAHGPDFDGPWPEVPATAATRFLGLPVRSTFGVAASLLVNEAWVRTYARLGFDLLTYKTVRSQPWRSHPMPNWLFAQPETAARLADPSVDQLALPDWPDDLSTASAAGSLGMPSTAPEVWQEDIGRSRAALGDGQVLIVSVVATVGPDTRRADMLHEFEDLAARVRAAGADAVEANLSCPNVDAREGEVFRDAALAAEIGQAIANGAGGAPTLLKIGHLEDDGALGALLRTVADHVDAVVMVNGVSRRIVGPAGAPAYGPGRERSGIIGDALRPLALDQVARARRIIDAEALPLEIVGVGGASKAAHVQAFRDAGACAIQCASAATWNPCLAVELKAAGVA